MSEHVVLGYTQEERSEIASDVLASLRDAESGLWILDHDLARDARLLIERVATDSDSGVA